MLYFALGLLALVSANDEYSESSEGTICYGDDECRGLQVCDMGTYICKNPTPSPETPSPTEAAGCCYGDSYKANGKCARATSRDKCEDMGCSFLETDDATDCEMTTTESATTAQEVGCCKGDSAKTNDMCNSRLTRSQCDRSSSCHFILDGVVDVDCLFPATQPPEDPGCCYGNPDAAYSKRWMDACTSYSTERECLMLTDDDGVARCVFEEMNEYMDCSMLWPTTTTTTVAPGCCRGSSYKAQAKCFGIEDQVGCERKDCDWVLTGDDSDCEITTTTSSPTTTTTEEPGCCKADSIKREDMCLARDTREKCEKSSSCVEWISGEDADCSFQQTTTEEPGCCYGNPDAAYSKRWMDACIEYQTERECLMLTDDDGVARCVFEEMNEYMDCSALWPTTTTTTEEPGCCRGSSYKAQAKCFGIEDQVGCERKDCDWVLTDDDSDCEITTTTSSPTTTTTATPGCCKGTSRTSNDACNDIEDADQCDRRSSCTFIPFGIIDIDCVFPATEPPEDPGCCYGNPDIAYSKRWMENCKTFATESECLMLENEHGEARCTFEPMGEYEDCETVWPTTTTTPTTTPSPLGCCYGDSYKANGKCAMASSEDKCKAKGCNWLETEDPTECEMTTTETPTTTVMPGCCRGESMAANDKCNSIEDNDKCNARSSCTFVNFGVLEEDCVFEATAPPEEPGCCYGNPDIAYSKRWMESCKTFGTEAECLMLTDGDGASRCTFEPMGEYEDCETVWPTTTATPTTTVLPGCCRGSSYKAQAKCFGIEDQVGCERKDCEWLETEDTSDCEITTTTSSPTTPSPTDAPGCCYGDSYKANGKCARATSPDKCDEMGCSFLVTEDPTDCEMTTTKTPETPTTTEEAGCCYGEGVKDNEMCGNKVGRDQCERSGSCEFRSGDNADCTYVQTTQTDEPGCCYGETAKTNEMCGDKVGREQCERSGKCEFRSGEDADCELPTTTSVPWLGAQEEHSLPFNPYKASKQSAKKGRRQEEAMLFGAHNGSVVAEAMDYQVSLSSLLLFVAAALAVHQVYRCYAARNAAGYKALPTAQTDGYYQTA